PPPPPALIASDHHHDNRPHLLLSATGSVATIKLPLILSYLSTHHPNLSIRLILSPTALTFLSGQSAEQPTPATLLATIPTLEAIYLDSDEWLRPWVRGDPILHIELRRWADLMVIAPLSANAMAGLCGGFSSSLILSVARAWDGTGTIDEERPSGIILCPAMNTAMWNHPVTSSHMAKLEGEWNVDREGGWVEVLRPVEKNLACGDVGSGAMREWREICGLVEERLGLS
ncbi:putative phosphopantothenoylcysteine decarboxylase, partial [Zymoseptoria tritici IPO323]